MLKNLRKSFSLSFLSICPFSKTVEKEIYSEFTRRKSKFHENRNMVENIFFPEYIKQSQNDELKKILQNKSKETPDSQFLLEDAEYQQLMRLKAPKKRMDESSTPKTREEVLELISVININERLLQLYSKNSKLFGAREIHRLMKKLEWTLNNREEIKKREMMRFERKKENLKKINDAVELKFTAVFLNKEMVLGHKEWEFMIRDIEGKIVGENYSNIDSILICKAIMMFTLKDLPHNLLLAIKNVRFF